MSVDACVHRAGDEGRCLRCGVCLHELVVNRVCDTCGVTDPVVTVERAARDVVPAAHLRRPPR